MRYQNKMIESEMQIEDYINLIGTADCTLTLFKDGFKYVAEVITPDNITYEYESDDSFLLAIKKYFTEVRWADNNDEV